MCLDHVLGHETGVQRSGFTGKIWWVGNDGKVRMFDSTGHEMHHDLNRRMDMDARWRGRLELSTGIVTMQPPLKQLNATPRRETISVPAPLLRSLHRKGGIQFFVALLDGRLHLAGKECPSTVARGRWGNSDIEVRAC